MGNNYNFSIFYLQCACLVQASGRRCLVLLLADRSISPLPEHCCVSSEIQKQYQLNLMLSLMPQVQLIEQCVAVLGGTQICTAIV